MKTNLAKYVCGLSLLGALATATAQTSWNYFISAAGGGNSLVTWSVTGSLATPPGAFLLNPQSSVAVSIIAPGIYNDSYSPSGVPQPIPTPDGSYFQIGGHEIYAAIVSYNAYNSPSGGNDVFDLETTTLPPHLLGPGVGLVYIPGTQSALIPIAFSDFNPGIYQSEESGFGTALTVNLTVGPVPEPSALACIVIAAIFTALASKKGKRLRYEA